MSINGGDGTLHQNTISGNAAGDTGGGLHVEGADLTLTGNTFYSNTSNSGGGGVFAEERSQLTMTNNLVADNQPVGVLVLGSTANMQHTTLARNGAYGISLTDQEGEYSTVNMTNTLLSGHTAAGVYVYAGNTANLEGTLWGSEDWSGDGTILTGTVNFWGDPDFVNPGSGDFHIGPDSAAIDHAVYTEVSVDIDGDPRPYGASADIGADEYASMVWVTKDAFPDTVQAGAQLTYTLLVTNNGAVDLTASITDELPAHVTPSGLLTWGPVSITPHDTWTKTVVVTVENEYSGTLVNVVQVNTVEGATDIYTETSHALFTPSNQAPYTPSNPTPADGATAVPITQTLSWQGGDPDDDLVTYTVSLGATDPPPIVVTTTLTAYSPVLAADTTYYWLVTATDGISVTAGQPWLFTTMEIWTPSNQEPYVPSNPTPADGATAVPVTQTLSWQGGDPDGDVVTYTVKLGVNHPHPIVVTTPLTEYASILAADTTYHWLVTATDGISVSTGQIWHFTTADEWHNLYLPLVLKTG
jgi:uncharacterized repeat protein (TIGR01451 family)